MNNKRIWIISILGLVLVALLMLIIKDLFFSAPQNSISSQTLPTVDNTGLSNIIESQSSGTDVFRQEVPVNVKVPEVNTVLSEAEKKVIAVPTVVVPAAPGATAQLRNFNIFAEGGKFIPSQIIANVGDTVHINFTAVDKDYDIVFPSYNMKQVATQGQTKILEFQALEDGSFLYYCESCGGSNSATDGKIIIVK